MTLCLMQTMAVSKGPARARGDLGQVDYFSVCADTRCESDLGEREGRLCCLAGLFLAVMAGPTPLQRRPSQSLPHRSGWDGDLTTPAAPDLVPLSTQIISPTLAEAFLIPFQALSGANVAQEPVAARQQSLYPTQPTPGRALSGFVRYEAPQYDEVVRPYGQAGATGLQHEASGSFRLQGNGSGLLRPQQVDRPVGVHPALPTAAPTRDQSVPTKQSAGTLLA